MVKLNNCSTHSSSCLKESNELITLTLNSPKANNRKGSKSDKRDGHAMEPPHPSQRYE